MDGWKEGTVIGREREREFRWWLNGGRDYRWMDEERESERKDYR